VEDLSEQLKQEKQRVLTLEGQLNTATLSLQALGEVQLELLLLKFLHFFPSFLLCNLMQSSVPQLQERVSDLEEERILLKKSYDSLLERSVFHRI